MRELHHIPFVGNLGSRYLADNPDATIAPALGRKLLPQVSDVRRPDREAELIIVATRQGELACAFLADGADEGFGDRNILVVDLDATSARVGELSRIAEQTIRNVDARAGVFT
jgi:hypothetical protein